MSNVSKRTISSKAGVVPTLRFEDQSLTSFAGLVVFQRSGPHPSDNLAALLRCSLIS